VVVGAETGQRPNKIVPDLDWIEAIVSYCAVNLIPLFMKNNLGTAMMIQEYPRRGV